MPGTGFAKIASQLRALSDKGALSVSRATAREAQRQSQQCFRESRDPYGKSWAPLKRREGKPLERTGRGRSSVAVGSISTTGFRIGTNVAYMRYHQDGVDATYTRKASSRFQPVGGNGRFMSKRAAGKKRQGTLYNASRIRHLSFGAKDVHLVIPQRAFLPIRGRGLGTWEIPIVRAAQTAITRLVAQG